MNTLPMLIVTLCAAVYTVQAISPINVTLDGGTFQGTTSNGINTFLGIPFAQPPVGDLRFRLPQRLGPYNGTHDASTFGPPCPQQSLLSFTQVGIPQEAVDYLVNTTFVRADQGSEDCLTLNVISPSQATSGSNLPVVAWIYGGGFEVGASSGTDGDVIVERSVALGEPVIYVSMNYRLSAFGFLASQEVKDAGVGNLGLQDQRLALRWIQQYISVFGGDPTKVTIWGQSAGGISASLQLLTNGGNSEGLFRAAFMQSGFPTPVGDITNGQPYYDALVEYCGCSGTVDTLACLRTVPFEILQQAVDASPSFTDYQSLALAWMPRVDGVFLTDTPQQLILDGQVADVPFITGDCDDEGTAFALPSLNITTTEQLQEYLSTFFIRGALDAELVELLIMYPEDPAQGSPFDTGDSNALTPQFKRIAALLGDIVFQAPRRFLMHQRSGKQNTWSYLSKRLKFIPFLGSLHGCDMKNIYGTGELRDYLIHFVTNLDPNGGSSRAWPQYTTASPQLMTLISLTGMNITQDTFRTVAIDRSWLVHFWELDVKWVGLALPFGFIPGLWVLLFFFDHNVSSLIAQGSQFPLRKPAGFHYDFALLGLTTLLAGLLGIHAPNGLIPQAPIHTRALLVHKVVNQDEDVLCDGDGNACVREVPIAVVEQRASNLAQGSLCLVLFSTPFLHVLHLVPQGVLAGLFWYMGLDELSVNGITQKALYFLTDRTLTHHSQPLRHVRKSRVLLFVAVQLVAFGVTFAITQTVAAIGFPIIILPLAPLRPTASPFTMQSVSGF